jgi:hypothetical protein
VPHNPLHLLLAVEVDDSALMDLLDGGEMMMDDDEEEQ